MKMAHLILQEFAAVFSKNEQRVAEKIVQYYVYCIIGNGFDVAGLVGLVPHEQFLSHFVVPHEQTFPDKEKTYAESLLQLRIQLNPILLFYRDCLALTEVLRAIRLETLPVVTWDEHNLCHQIYPVTNNKFTSLIKRCIESVRRLYVADGHHRVKASLLAAEQDLTIPPFCLSMLVDASSLHLGSIHRCLAQDGVASASDILNHIEEYWNILEVPCLDLSNNECHFFFHGKWYTLQLKPRFLHQLDGIRKLHPHQIEEYLLKPVFRVMDQRLDKRLKFIPNIHGATYLDIMTSVGTVGIFLPPLTISELCYIADQGATVPPHSTYLQPKAADSLISWKY